MEIIGTKSEEYDNETKVDLEQYLKVVKKNSALARESIDLQFSEGEYRYQLIQQGPEIQSLNDEIEKIQNEISYLDKKSLKLMEKIENKKG